MNRESIPLQLSTAKKEAATRFLTDSAKAAYPQALTRFEYTLTGNSRKPRYPSHNSCLRQYGASRLTWLKPADSRPSPCHQHQSPLETAGGLSDLERLSVLHPSETWSRRGLWVLS